MLNYRQACDRCTEISIGMIAAVDAEWRITPSAQSALRATPRSTSDTSQPRTENGERCQRVRRSYEASMLTRVLLAVLMIASAGFAIGAETATGPAPEFALGQEWSIKSASPTTAKAVIDRLEPWHEKVVVHVSIVDLPIPQGLPG